MKSVGIRGWKKKRGPRGPALGGTKGGVPRLYCTRVRGAGAKLAAMQGSAFLAWERLGPSGRAEARLRHAAGSWRGRPRKLSGATQTNDRGATQKRRQDETIGGPVNKPA